MWSLNLVRPQARENKLEAGSWNKLKNVSWTVEREELESWD